VGSIVNLAGLRLEHVLQHANDGFWDWDLVTGGVYYSPRWNLVGDGLSV
jgi:hypothetical protein